MGSDTSSLPSDPDDPSSSWIQGLWEGIVLGALGHRWTPPVWLRYPAVTQTTVTSPAILRRLTEGQSRVRYEEGIKPFNFVLVAHVAPFGHPVGVEPKRFQLIAPYSSDPRQWMTQPWRDRYSDQRFTITTAKAADVHSVRVKTYEDVLDVYRVHAEPKSLGPDGTPCTRKTVGLLRRRHVRVTTITYIGKESNRIDEVTAGLIHDWNDVQVSYDDPRCDPWDTLVRPILRRMPRAELARATGVSERYIRALRNGHRRPSSNVRGALIRAAADHARACLGEPIPDDLAACAAYLQTSRQR